MQEPKLNDGRFLFPVNDHVTKEDIDKFGLLPASYDYEPATASHLARTLNRMMGTQIMAVVNSTRRRKPKKGEWFLSGAIPAAYRADNDLSTEYHICDLVRVRPHTTYFLVSKKPDH